MKRLSRILPLLLAAVLLPLPLLGQAQNGTLVGRVIDRDGTTPLQGAVIWIDQLVTNSGRIVVRERLQTKTGRDGRYQMAGLYIGRVRVTVVVNNQPVMVKGDAVGDELYLATGLDTVANFDLSKAPAAPPVAAAADVTPAPGNEKEREELRKKLEEQAAKAGVMYKAFEEGKVAHGAKNYDEAITKFKAAIDAIPVPPPPNVADIIWANLAMTYDAKRDYVEAETAYKKAIEYKGTEPAYWVNLSLAQIANGKMDEGQGSIQKAAALNPASAGMAYYNMGATLVNRNKPKDAVTFFKKAIEVDPMYSNAYYQLGITLIGENETGEAMMYLAKYVELVPTGQDSQTAKLLIDELKKTAPTTFQNPAPTKGGSTTPKQPATKGNTK
ncbi:MAG TPA: tetratricopeptide repeat protein [Terriglobia bacterium]|nr:tetratricopeptide repeat protein [Terriglobia bacterium]